jgi:hypothetical protein
MSLVPIPYQPGFKLTQSTLNLLMEAGRIAGHEITVTDAWRSYAEQAYYWDQYINHGGNVASNPDTGQRNHMRGAAVDILNTGSVNRNAMLSAGFTPDPDESWHFNDPNWQNMPIIPTDDSSSAPSSFVTKGKNMKLVWDTAGTGYLVTEDGVLALGGPQIYNLFYRVINSNQLATPFDVKGWIPSAQGGQPQVFLKAEMDIMNANLKLLSVQKQTGVTIDPTKLASALKDALGSELKVDADLSDDDIAKLASAYDVAVPRIAAAVVKQAGSALAGAK